MRIFRQASKGWWTFINFDTVNDTGSECHGFEIEIEDCRSTDISYTYDYNHYGTPKITQDDSIPLHPKCIIRWERRKNADGSWSLVPLGWVLQESPDLTPGSWTDSTRDDNPHDGLHHVEVASPGPPQMFFRLRKP